MNGFHWELIRAFLAVAEQGSVSAAARVLGVSQPTLSRQVRALEAEMRLSLFERSTRGLELTEPGARLMEAARRMGDGAELFARLATGLSVELSGDVRISANEVVGYHLLPPLIAAFRREHPGVDVEVVITNRTSSLGKREADLALRMFRPTQPDLVAQRLPDLELGLYAHHDYLERHGRPDTPEALAAHALIGFDEERSFIEAAAALGTRLRRSDFPIRSDHMPLHIALLRAGAGIGATHAGLARRFPELERVLPDIGLPALEFWCVAHRDVQFNARIRALMTFVREWFGTDPYARALV